MALKFDSAGTCLIVRQYLERSNNILRSDLGEKIQLLLSQGTNTYGQSNRKSQNKAPSATEVKTTLSGEANNGPTTTIVSTITV